MEEYEDEITEIAPIRSIKHNKWSILVLSLSYLSRVAEVTTSALSQGCDMAAQHANYVTDQDRFLEAARKWKDDG